MAPSFVVARRSSRSSSAGASAPGASRSITMSLFRKRAFSSGLGVIALVFFGGMIGLMLAFTLYLQLGLGFSAIHAGLALVPWSLGMAIGAGARRRPCSRRGSAAGRCTRARGDARRRRSRRSP